MNTPFNFDPQKIASDLAGEATPKARSTPRTKTTKTKPASEGHDVFSPPAIKKDNVAPSVNVKTFVVDNPPVSEADKVRLALNVDPSTAAQLVQLGKDDSMKVGAYTENGDIFVYVDSLDLNKLHSYAAKELAYAFRYSLGMANAGISTFSAPMRVDATDTEVPPAIVDPKKPTYRAVFQLTRSPF